MKEGSSINSCAPTCTPVSTNTAAVMHNALAPPTPRHTPSNSPRVREGKFCRLNGECASWLAKLPQNNYPLVMSFHSVTKGLIKRVRLPSTPESIFVITTSIDKRREPSNRSGMRQTKLKKTQDDKLHKPSPSGEAFFRMKAKKGEKVVWSGE